MTRDRAQELRDVERMFVDVPKHFESIKENVAMTNDMTNDMTIDNLTETVEVEHDTVAKAFEDLAEFIRDAVYWQGTMDLEEFKKRATMYDLAYNTATDSLWVITGVHSGYIFAYDNNNEVYTQLEESASKDFIIYEQFKVGDLLETNLGTLYKITNKRVTGVKSVHDIEYLLHVLNDREPNEEGKTIRLSGKYIKDNGYKLYEVPSDEDVNSKFSSYEVLNEVKNWALVRNLQTAQPQSQMLKLVEEAGEIITAMQDGDIAEILDGVGDVIVVLTVMSTQVESGDDMYEAIEVELGSSDLFLSENRNFDTGTASTALMRLLGELSSAVARGQHEKYADITSSIVSTLYSILQSVVEPYFFEIADEEEREDFYAPYGLLDISILSIAIRLAYNEIKHRKGKMVDGVFVKEADL